MPARLLQAPPESSAIPVVGFDEEPGDNTWVLIEPPDAERWIGVFGNGPVGVLSVTLPFPDGTNLLVVARGQGYVVDARRRRLQRKTPWDCAFTTLLVPERDFLLAADSAELWAVHSLHDRYATVETHGWSSKGWVPLPREPHRLADNGLLVDEVTRDGVRGRGCWPDGWWEFELDFADWHAWIGARVAGRDADLTATADRGGCPVTEEYYDRMRRYWF